MSRQTQVPLDFEGEALEGVLVGRRDSQSRPTVILIPTVMGVSDLEIGFGSQLVELGIGLLAADGEEELLLGGEVAIDEADAHARLGGDRRHIGAESRSGEGAACALQDPFADGRGMLSGGLARGGLGEGSGWGRHALSSPWMNIYSFWP